MMIQPLYYRTNSVLHCLNPLSKVIATLPVLVLLNLVSTLWVQLGLIIFHFALLLILGRIPPLRLLRVMAPLLITVAGFLVFYPPFVSSDVVAGSPVLFMVGSIPVHMAGIIFGLTTCVRLLAFYTVMLVFVLTTDASDFARALIQHWHVNYRLGYAAMAAYRFIPLLESELNIIRAAHKVRGVSTQRGLWAQFQGLLRASIPLLASAIRSAERKALAMDARAFGAFATRTYYRRLHFTLRDGIFIAVYWLVSIGMIGMLSSGH